MRFALNSDHKEFYTKNGFIEFEKLLGENELASLQQEINTALASRLHISPTSLPQKGCNAIFGAGFDLWRESSAIKKRLFKTTWSEIAAQLFQSQLLRVGFDQYIDTGSGQESPLKAPLSLNALSCASPLAGALIIRLSATPDSSQTCPIPSSSGSVIFLSADKVIPWVELFAQKDLRLLILAYGAKKTFYRLEKNDPHTHIWKGLGYVFGDLLNDNHHPILYRAG